jgi:hypothetical protein
MANYIIKKCLTNDEYVVSAVTLTLGESIRFGVGEDLFCGSVEAVTESSITPGYYYDFAQYTDCCECLEDGTESLNFNFIRCGTSEEINIESDNFCTEYGVPTTGLTYEIQFGSETPFCATFEGLSESGVTNYHYSSGPFSLCNECIIDIPRSANTETAICYTCFSDVNNGTAFYYTNTVPHPVYTDGYGTPVTQLDMVTLGGVNGLNN